MASPGWGYWTEIGEGLISACMLLGTGDPETWSVIRQSLLISLSATFLSFLLGIPLGAWVALSSSGLRPAPDRLQRRLWPPPCGHWSAHGHPPGTARPVGRAALALHADRHGPRPVRAELSDHGQLDHCGSAAAQPQAPAPDARAGRVPLATA